jgi:predicted Zn-dependent peptidase
MRYVRYFTILVLAATLFSSASLAQTAGKLPPINVKEYTLKNGLRVITHVDRSTPVVSVGTWYHVGSKNETPGRTGFAHLFEHMMFQGSKNYDSDYFTPARGRRQHKRHDQRGPHLVL